MKKAGLARFYIVGLVAVVALTAGLQAAQVQIVAPSLLQKNQTYTAYVQANNTGLSGAPTDAIDWTLAIPSYLKISNYAAAPATNDFFSVGGVPIPMFVNWITVPGSSTRMVNAPGSGPVNQGWSVLGQFDFMIDPAYQGQLPTSGSFTLSGIKFYSPTATVQTSTNLTPTFGFNLDLTNYLAGDTDRNGKIDGVDLATLSQNWDPLGTTSRNWTQGDFDGNGKIDGVDLAALAQGWSPLGYLGGSVPEPATMSLLCLGALGLLRRRK